MRRMAPHPGCVKQQTKMMSTIPQMSAESSKRNMSAPNTAERQRRETLMRCLLENT